MKKILMILAILGFANVANAQMEGLSARLQQGADNEFKKMDKNNNGKISQEEYVAFLSTEGIDGETKEKSIIAFKQIDLDGDGSISNEEYKQFMDFATSAINDFMSKAGNLKVQK